MTGEAGVLLHRRHTRWAARSPSSTRPRGPGSSPDRWSIMNPRRMPGCSSGAGAGAPRGTSMHEPAAVLSRRRRATAHHPRPRPIVRAAVRDPGPDRGDGAAGVSLGDATRSTVNVEPEVAERLFRHPERCDVSSGDPRHGGRDLYVYRADADLDRGPNLNPAAGAAPGLDLFVWRRDRDDVYVADGDTDTNERASAPDLQDTDPGVGLRMAREPDRDTPRDRWGRERELK